MKDQEKMLPESSASYTGGTNGAAEGVSRSDLQQGFSAVESPQRFEDVNGDSYADNAFKGKRGGFAGRPQGWER